MGNAADRWREELASWAIPEPILKAAPESPWTFPVELFAGRADAAVRRSEPTPSNLRALAALPEHGSVLDVGCGAGAASLPLAGRAGRLVGVDSSGPMLAAFLDRTAAAVVAAEAVKGSWPDAADAVGLADVVVCHHVFYNAPDLVSFAEALTSKARRRVVVELTARHPMSNLNELWRRFHGLDRPERPTADDAVAVLRETGLDPDREDWESPGAGGFARREDLVAFVRRRLCLPAERDAEVADALGGSIVERSDGFGFPSRPVVTLWWPGAA